jgi:hypothetical protein
MNVMSMNLASRLAESEILVLLIKLQSLLESPNLLRASSNELFYLANPDSF